MGRGRTGSRSGWRGLAGVSIVCAAVLALTPMTPADAAPDEDFTIVVIPDTQGYTMSSSFESTFDQQAAGIVEDLHRPTRTIPMVHVRP